MKNEAESKSQQRRIKAQTGQDVPLSAQAAEALGEGTAAPKPGSPPKPAAKAPPPGSPILSIHEEMPSDRIRTIFETYRAAERKGAAVLLDRISIDLGKKIGAAEKVRHDAFELIKKDEEYNRVKARKTYEAGLRAAKSAYDKAINVITEDSNARRKMSREDFNTAAAPINVEMDATQKKIANDYTAKIQAAVSELQPIAKKVQEKEEKRKADLRAKAEADEAEMGAVPMVAPHAEVNTMMISGDVSDLEAGASA